MKVLHLIDSGGLYGAEKMLVALVQEQIDQGIEPMILSAGEREIGEKAIEIESKRLGLPVTPWRMKSGLNLKEVFGMLQWARAQGYDLFHSHGYKFNILVGLLPRRIRRIPIISTVHGYVKAKFPKKIWFYELLDRIALRSVDHVVFVRDGMEVDVGRFQRSSVIPNGITLEQDISLAPLPDDIQSFILCHSKLVVAAGRLSKEKAFDVLVKAFDRLARNHPNVGLLIAGEGPERESLEQLANSLNLNTQVMMPGYLSNIPELLGQADVLVISSYTEGLPMVLLEAMKAKCPIIATSVGGIPEVLDYGNAGTLIPRGNLVALVEELTHIFEAPEQVLHKVSRAEDRLVERYSAAAMTSDYKTLYGEVLNNKCAYDYT